MSATWTGQPIYHIAGGKIVEIWFFGDPLDLMQQIGAIPAPGRSEEASSLS